MLPSHSIPTYGSDMAQTVTYHFHTFAFVREALKPLDFQCVNSLTPLGVMFIKFRYPKSVGFIRKAALIDGIQISSSLFDSANLQF